jgi:hypothetical protein
MERNWETCGIFNCLDDSKRDLLVGDFRVKKFIPPVDISISMLFGKYK